MRLSGAPAPRVFIAVHQRAPISLGTEHVPPLGTSFHNWRMKSGACPHGLQSRLGTKFMSEATTEFTTSTSRSNNMPISTLGSVSKLEWPGVELPKVELPLAFREIAEKSVSQAKETYEKLKSAAEEAADALEESYANAS